MHFNETSLKLSILHFTHPLCHTAGRNYHSIKLATKQGQTEDRSSNKTSPSALCKATRTHCIKYLYVCAYICIYYTYHSRHDRTRSFEMTTGQKKNAPWRWRGPRGVERGCAERQGGAATRQKSNPRWQDPLATYANTIRMKRAECRVRSRARTVLLKGPSCLFLRISIISVTEQADQTDLSASSFAQCPRGWASSFYPSFRQEVVGAWAGRGRRFTVNQDELLARVQKEREFFDTEHAIVNKQEGDIYLKKWFFINSVRKYMFGFSV